MQPTDARTYRWSMVIGSAIVGIGLTWISWAAWLIAVGFRRMEHEPPA